MKKSAIFLCALFLIFASCRKDPTTGSDPNDEGSFVRVTDAPGRGMETRELILPISSLFIHLPIRTETDGVIFRGLQTSWIILTSWELLLCGFRPYIRQCLITATM